MKQERFSEEKIVGILRAAEKGEKPVAELCREHGIAEQFLMPGLHGATAHEKRVVYWDLRPPIREIVPSVVPVTLRARRAVRSAYLDIPRFVAPAWQRAANTQGRVCSQL